MAEVLENINANAGISDWRGIVKKYNFPDRKKSIWQLINSICPFIGIWIMMYYSMQVSYWITIALAFPAAGFMVRIFIIFHDCGHKSFFKEKKWNDRVGFITGLFSFTPYDKWHNGHHQHHATVGNLDKRGIGDVMTMTLDEYKAASKIRRLTYRLYRNPLTMLGIGAPIVFIVVNRFFSRDALPREKWNVVWTNVTLAVIITLISLAVGFKSFVLIQFPVLYISSVCGLWLFYVQHQFRNVHWYRNKDWDFFTVAMNGSSFYKLPRLFQWFSGNIGFHHIHHLSSRIPNYKLDKCHNENQMFSKVEPMTWLSSLKSLKLRLWDENSNQLISFKEALGPVR